MPLWNPKHRKAPLDRTQPAEAPLPATPVASLNDAYDRGRRDERARHRRSPALTLAVALTATVGGWTLVSAAVGGSFEGGGRMIDGQLVTAAREARPLLRQAAQGAQKLISGEAFAETLQR